MDLIVRVRYKNIDWIPISQQFISWFQVSPVVWFFCCIYDSLSRKGLVQAQTPLVEAMHVCDMETQSLQLTFNYIALIICSVGICSNALWISVYLRSYQIHIEMVGFASIMDLLVVVQSATDLIMCVVAVIFNSWLICMIQIRMIKLYTFMIHLTSITM